MSRSQGFNVLTLRRKPNALCTGRRLENQRRYGTVFPTLSDREAWVREQYQDPQQVAYWLQAVRREHLLDLREVYPDHKQAIAHVLRRMPRKFSVNLGKLD